MDPKWRLFLVLLTAWTSFSLSSAICEPPANALKVTADQIKGLWSMRVIANFDDFYVNFACVRIEHNFENETHGVASYSAIDMGAGKFISLLLYGVILKGQMVHFTLASDPNQSYTFDILLINDKGYVASGCYFVGKDKAQKYTIVATRSLTTTEAEANDLLKQAGVTVTKSFVFNNAGNCYKWNSC